MKYIQKGSEKDDYPFATRQIVVCPVTLSRKGNYRNMDENIDEFQEV